MALETASYIANLVATNPDGADQRNTADDHIRLTKAVLKRSLPLIDGAVSLSQTQLMFLNDVSRSVQFQLNTLRDGSATAANAIYANSASYAAFAGQAASASLATLALTANSASYAALAGQAASASFATLAATANSASYAALAGTASLAALATLATTANSASYAALAGQANSASYATFANSASSASTLRGVAPDTSAAFSTIVQRNAAGYAYAVYFNQSSSDTENASVGVFVTGQLGDGFLRKCTAAHAGQYLEAQNISGRTGTRKNLVAGSGPPTLSAGSQNGEMWFYY